MTPLTEDQFAEAERLDAEARKGPWFCDSTDKAAIASSNFEVFTEDDGWGGCNVADNVLTAPDADLIAFMRNHGPQAFRELREAREALKAVARLRRGKYTAWHYAGGVNDCAHGYSEGIPCPKCDEETVAAALRAIGEAE